MPRRKELLRSHSVLPREEELEGDIYDLEGAQQLEEDDEITPWEEGFLQGSMNWHLIRDALTGKIITNQSQAYELRIGNELYWFENEHNAKIYLKHRKK